ncbi:type I-F CRISPR-associated endoribonuclease Cas6/Csy4 [Methylocucumis oryzae]
MWIKKTVVAESSGTTFSSYGLSATSTVPEF